MYPHPNRGVERRFLISIAITSLILFAEVIGGIWTGSLALLSDAAHVFMDIFALALSFVALRLSALPPDDKHSYGYHRLEVFAALVNGISLVAIAVGIWWEAINRFSHLQEIRSTEMMVIAAIGLVANLVVAFILGRPEGTGDEHHHSVEDLNVHSAFLHVLGDAISSVGVILAAVLISFTGWEWLDPLVSIFIGGLIGVSAYRVTRSSIHILIEGVPVGMSMPKVETAIQQIQGVANVHDLHIWSICSGHAALSAHIMLDNFQDDHSDLRNRIKEALEHQFGIEHTTLQFESEPCNEQFRGCGSPVMAPSQVEKINRV
jgi:cobalt-zinc-cadmium efflux system protein